jgi:PleD family two-component response regulator
MNWAHFVMIGPMQLRERQSDMLLSRDIPEIFRNYLAMTILALSTDQELNSFRQFVLSAAGHDVVVVNSEKQALTVAKNDARYDVVLLCHKLPASTGRLLVRLLRQHKPTAKIVYISHIYGEWPEVEADRYIVGADGPEALSRVLEEVSVTAA